MKALGITPMVNWYLTACLRLMGTYGIGSLDRFNLKGNYRRNLIDKPLEPNQEIWANGMKIICSRGGRISKACTAEGALGYVLRMKTQLIPAIETTIEG